MAATMKAVVATQYGGPEVLALAEVARPTPGPTEVLVKVHASSVTRLDCRRRAGELRHLLPGRPPLVLGCDLAGVVVAVGRATKELREGDAVLGLRPLLRGGAHAEYAVLAEAAAVRKPDRMEMTEAATLPLSGCAALQALRDRGGLLQGGAVLVNGAAGGLGLLTVQIAKALGAAVTGVCNKDAEALVRSVGADHTLDYQKVDLTRLSGAFDVVLDAAGNLTLAGCRKVLKAQGRFVSTVPSVQVVLDSLLSRITPGPRATWPLWVSPRHEDLATLIRLCDSGALHPIVDRSFPFSEAAAAHRYVEEGRPRGKVVLVPG
jgi:NADPH:quinone reductase-like Zn-dependent oxidoreductase